MRSWTFRGLFVVVLALLLAAPPAGAHGRGYHHSYRQFTPMVFVHGGAGSGAQFESQALRFTSNGYPQKFIKVLEYDSTFGVNTREQVLANLDALIAQLKQPLPDVPRPRVHVDRERGQVIRIRDGTIRRHRALPSHAPTATASAARRSAVNRLAKAATSAQSVYS